MTMNTPSDPARARDRGRLYRISLDLGSDSTVAYVALPGQSRIQRIDLQFFLRALAVEPDFLLESKGRRSHRLKSRYALNAQFQSPEPLRTAFHPVYGYPEVLPAGHPRLPLLDFDRYLREESSGGAMVNLATESSRCLFKFIDDRSNPFAFKDLLPNAKLIFQSGVGLDKHLEMRYGGTVQRLKLHPVELIKNQVCLILENFVRPHPLLRNDQNEQPSWDECSVVLTVPNTYSPFHRDMLAQSVSLSLGCEVTTITESDAIVFYYIAKVQPDLGMPSEDLQKMEQMYLTIDVGKGTTDLTLMSLTYREGSREEKIARGLDPEAKRVLRHVWVAERTGRASGGAKMTYILAQFFERLVDVAMSHCLARMVTLPQDERNRLRNIDGSPLRLTSTSGPGILEGPGWGPRLLEFEKICEEYKKSLDLRGNGVFLPDLGADVGGLELAQHLIQQFRYYVAAAFDVILTDAQCDALTQAVRTAIETPGFFRPANMPGGKGGDASEEESKRLVEAWSTLEREVREYVAENADEVLIELATAHARGNDVGEFEDAVDALSFLMGTQGSAGKRSGFRPETVRTHVILAGQASQFKPLKDRFKKIVAEANLGTILSQEELERGVRKEVEVVAKGPQKPLAKRGMGFLKALFGDNEGGVEIACDEHIAVHLSGENLKDGCARGALDWFSSNPVMENQDSIHGQLLVTLAGGGIPIEVDMDALNSSRLRDLGPAELGDVYDSWKVYYLPTRGRKFENLRGQDASLMGVLDATDHIRIQIRPPEHPASQLIISTPSGQSLQLSEAVYDAVDPTKLRAMLWPAKLFDA
jgi:hypothetical protein